MNHEDAWKLLNDYVDRELPNDRIPDLEDHIAGCLDCRQEVRELRRLIGQAAELPPTIDPPYDLWPTIANAIESEAASGESEATQDILTDQSRRRIRDLPLARQLRSAFGFPEIRGIPTFAGTVLLAVILFVILKPGKPPAPENIAITEKISAERGLSPVTRATLQAIEAECLQADLELELFASREVTPLLHPVLERMNQDLRIVNQSITEIREAWKANPENPNLTRLLVRTYQAKVALQERMVEVSVIG
jgi:hypothetical protein